MGYIDGASLLVIGGGKASYEKRIRDLAVSTGVQGRVQFEGRVAHTAVRDQMHRCSVGIVPLSGRAGPDFRFYRSPLKLIEWMSSGVPVVASSVMSVAQHAEDGTDCLLVEPDRPEALARAMNRLRADEALHRRLAAGGLATATDRSYAHRAAKVLDFFESLSAKSGHSSEKTMVESRV